MNKANMAYWEMNNAWALQTRGILKDVPTCAYLPMLNDKNVFEKKDVKWMVP